MFTVNGCPAPRGTIAAARRDEANTGGCCPEAARAHTACVQGDAPIACALWTMRAVTWLRGRREAFGYELGKPPPRRPKATAPHDSEVLCVLVVANARLRVVPPMMTPLEFEGSLFTRDRERVHTLKRCSSDAAAASLALVCPQRALISCR